MTLARSLRWALGPTDIVRVGRPAVLLGAASLWLLAACTGHPSEGAARGAATGAAGALILGSPAVVAVPAGAATGATANSFWQAWLDRRNQCDQLRRCVY